MKTAIRIIGILIPISLTILAINSNYPILLVPGVIASIYSILKK
jgi:hypothetical protein